MKSVILCEGKDDLWFIAYYLHKVANWMLDKNSPGWRHMKIPVDAPKQSCVYFYNRSTNDSLAIVSVGGQDRLKQKIEQIEHINDSYPSDPIGSIVIFRDRDDRETQELLLTMQGWFHDLVVLQNKQISVIEKNIDEIAFSVNVLPIIIPYEEQGAIETLLLEALEQKGDEEALIRHTAHEYVYNIKGQVNNYLQKQRLVTKSEYSAAIAITNPDHSTALFQEMMLTFEWENTPVAKNLFQKILLAVTTPSLS